MRSTKTSKALAVAALKNQLAFLELAKVAHKIRRLKKKPAR